MEPWIKLTFCHFNDFRTLVEKFEKDKDIINRKMGARSDTILHRAALNRRVEMVEFLLDQGAPQIEDGNGNYPLHCVALGGDRVIAQKLIDAGADLEAPNHEHDKPLHLAASVGNLEVVFTFLDAGADLKSRGWLENTALHCAAEAAQVEVMKELVKRGLEVDTINAKGEHPIHLAAGVKGKGGDIEHLEFLLHSGANVKKSRTNEGCTAAHYAAKSGQVEALQLLLDAECPVTKAKMNEEYRWYTVGAGDTLLESVAESCCHKKGSLILNRIMAARYKERRTRALADIHLGRKDNCKYNYEELTSQELELSHMYTELEKSLENPKSVLRMFLQNCPDSVKSLLDDCVMSNMENSTDNIGKVVFDFFLFCPENTDTCELSTIDLVIATGKKKLIEHPLFETFIRLKWMKVWKLYTVTFLFLAIHMIALIGYSLLCFSHTFENVGKIWMDIFWMFLLASNIIITILQLTKVHGLLFKNCYKTQKQTDHSLSDWIERQERFYPMMDTSTPLMGFFVLFFKSKELTVFLILYSSWQSMRSLTMFPRVGKNVFITSKVTRTISEFFISYLIEILAFTLAFHILLPENAIFRDLGDSFVKVITMLLGEFEYNDLVEGGQATWWTKIVFLMFIMMMSIVLINLVIGLSINDINTLRKEAHIHKLINTVSAIKSVEHLTNTINRLFPCLHYDTRLTSQKTCAFEDQVYLDIPNLDYMTQNFIFVKREGDENSEKYPCPKTIIESVATLVKKRLEIKNCELDMSKRRNSLLKKIIKFEDAFVEGACKTLVRSAWSDLISPTLNCKTDKSNP